ncbi:hypothetical protein CEQ90_11360 [Lewinellaceae bacterium SD302]|nr:hypothetical protein CEQ90_11360 [Lewinellaceae bacterium SD302]
MKFLPSLLCLAFITCLTAQQIDLSGRVSIHNSRYRTGQIEYVADAFVSAPFAGETGTDSEGRFSLTFQGIEGGTTIKLAAEKAGLEVVNSYDLERVVLGQKASLSVFLAPKGQLARAQTELYNISKEALFARRDALITRLRGEKAEQEMALAELSEDLNVEINSIGEAIELLTNQVKVLQKQLPEFAQQLAAKNLDFASERYVQAYEKFKTGDVRATLNILDGEALYRSYKQAVVSQENGQHLIDSGNELQQRAELQIQQVLESYYLKAQAHLTLFEYGAATATRQLIVNILEARDGTKTSLELVYAYDQLASALTDIGRFTPALTYQRKAVQALQQHYPNGHIHLSRARTTLSNAYLSLGLLDSALLHQEIALIAQEASLPPGHFDLIRSYNNLSLILQNQGEYTRALGIIRYAIEGMEKNQQHLSSLATMYGNLGSIYTELGEYNKALSAQIRGIELLLTIEGGENNPDLAQYYTNLANTYQGMGKYDLALEVQEKAIQVQAKLLESLHPALITSQNNLSLIYRQLGYYQEALSLQLQVVAAARKTLNLEHPLLASSINNLATIQNAVGNYQKALLLTKEAISLQENIFGVNHPRTATSYNNLAQIFGALNRYDEALDIHRKVIAIIRAALPPNHPELAITHHNIAGTYIELGLLDSALHHQLIANEISLKGQGPNHPNLVTNYGQLSRIYIYQENYPAAMQWQRAALSLGQKTLGANHPDLANAYHRMTTIYYNQEKLDSAIINEMQAYTLLRNAFPEGNHPSFEVIGKTLAFLYYERGKKYYAEEQLGLAAEDLQKAQDIGIPSEDISCLLARAYYLTSDLQRADRNLETCYQRGIIDESVYLPNRVMILSRLNRLTEAKQLLDEAKGKSETTSPDYHRAASLYHAAAGQTNQALNSLETAIQLGSEDVEWFATEPGLDTLRALPRFLALLAGFSKEGQ